MSIINKIKNGSSFHCISNQTGIDRKCLKDRKEKKDKIFSSVHKKLRYRNLGGGRKADTFKYENEILEFIKNCNKAGIPLKSSAVINKLLTLAPEYEEKTNNALKVWCYRFLRRHKLVFTKTTHIGQPIPISMTNNQYG